MPARRWFLVSALAVIGVACGDAGPNDTEARYLFSDGASAAPADLFVVVTTDQDVIRRVEAELRRPPAQRSLHLNGKLARGDGGHNLGWSWHVAPDGWSLVEVSIELCDARTKDVENDLDTWVDDIGQWCPWASRVVSRVS